MSISAIQNSGMYQAPEVQKAQAAPAAAPVKEAPAGEDRIVPEERAFDRYEPEAETTTANTDKVDRELENLRKRQEELTQQLRAAAPEQAEELQRRLDQITRELAQKDNDAYRRQHTVFS